MTRLLTLACTLAAAVVPATRAATEAPSFITFESGQVRPLAMGPGGSRLFALNTPDNRLEIFDIVDSRLEHSGSVAVGMEPVALAVRNETELWVVNHLSDSVSVVDVAGEVPRVVRTLLVGDEPRDIVFAGPGGGRAFVTTAHRGQHRTHPSIASVPGAGDPELTTAGVPRADVWVFDAAAPGSAFGGRPLRIVELFGDTPRALAVSRDGGTVYAAVFFSGNRTAVVGAGAVCDGFIASDEVDACPNQLSASPGGNPGPATNSAGAPAPEVGLVVRHDDASDEWRDELGRDWSNAIRFDLPDLDVFAIDASTLKQTASFSGVGTTLFNMAVNPMSGALYVSNTEARNEVRFEGSGKFGGSTVQGHLAEARITVLEQGKTPKVRHLNKHIDYDHRPAPSRIRGHSLATPLDMVVTSDGTTLYVAAFGSSKVGVFGTQSLENGSFDPRSTSSSYLDVSGGGPSGLALDESRQQLYVLTRFDNAISVIDLLSGAEIQHLKLHNPEPAQVVEGRPFLYDAVHTSSNGEASCAGCHIFGDFDGLAWDLGDPDGAVKQSPIPIVLGTTAEFLMPQINGTGNVEDFHPMKGPMTTQTLRGMVNSGAMHWRGDRAVGKFGTDPFDSDLSFRNFADAFAGLVGRSSPLPAHEMRLFSDFALEITLPPNPVRALDNSLSQEEKVGRDLFDGPRRSDGTATGPLGNTCADCHALDPAQGHFGTDGDQSFEAETQIVKIPHMRNLYQKVGMFGSPPDAFILPGNNQHQGDQVRGTGFLHDGSIDTLFRFFSATVFQQSGAVGFRSNDERRSMEAFALAFDTDLAPIVGQQITLDGSNKAEVGSRIDLLIDRAETSFVSRVLGGRTTECDLIVKGTIGGEPRGWLYNTSSKRFVADIEGSARLRDHDLRALAGGGQELTYTCAPPGSGRRMGIDRDLDGYLDGDERAAGSDPADGESIPVLCSPSATRLCLNDRRFEVEVDWKDFQDRGAAGQVVPFMSADSGIFWFSSPENWELMIKVLDGCALNGRFWVFSAATTNVEYSLRVRDTWADVTRSWFNASGDPAPAVTETGAFATCEASPPNQLGGSVGGVPASRLRAAPTSRLGADPRGATEACVPDGETLCLNEGRFRVEVEWEDFKQGSGQGNVVPFGSDDSGILWFFASDNWEMLVKVLDGCNLNGHYWVFSAATTNVEYTLRVTDTTSGAAREYRNPLGTAADAITDTAAFAACD